MTKINEQKIEDKSCANTNSVVNPTVNNKDKYKIDCVIVGQGKKADIRARAELTKAVDDNFKDVLQAFDILKYFSHCRSKRKPSHTKLPKYTWNKHYKSHSKMNNTDFKNSKSLYPKV